MKTMIRLVLVSMLLLIAAPAYSGSALHVFSCQQDEESSEAQIEAVASAWLKAAKSMKGGENMEVYVSYPTAVDMGENDFMFIITVPSFAEWGVFMDGYKDSPASKVDAQMGDHADCPDSSLWESEKIE